MQLRHIRPRSVEWYDAVEEEEAGSDGLSAEETLRLRTLVALEAAEVAQAPPPLGVAALVLSA
jgi:hypothetical protein